jgi:hypothetical protein
MIDRDSRDRLALALRRYASGRIHNDDLDGTKVDWRDRGAVAVKQMAWNLYSDTYQHYATGKNAVSKTLKRDIARWIVFLHSDREYLWPEYSFVQVRGLGFDILTFGWRKRVWERRWQEFRDSVDFPCWPFQDARELTGEAAKPRLLAGNRTGSRS